MKTRRWYLYILDATAFVLVFLLIEYALGTQIVYDRLGRAESWGHLNIAMANLQAYPDADIMIVGNSQGYRSINPYILMNDVEAATGEPISVINNSVSWIGMEGNVRFIRELFWEFQQAKILLVVVSPFMFGDLPEQDWQAVTEGTSTKVWFADEPYTPVLRWAFRHSLLLQYSNNIAFNLVGRHTPISVTATTRGFVANSTINPNVADFARIAGYPSYTMRNGGSNALESLIDWSVEQDVLIVLFTAAEHEGLLRGTSGEIYADFLADMHRFADSSPNVLFLDLQAQGRLTDLDYYDVIHVNADGADKWSHRLAEALVANDVLQRAGVGIVQLHGDNDLSVFHRQTAGILEFYTITNGVGTLAQQLDADQWKFMNEGDHLEFSSPGYQFTLEKLEDEFFYIYMYDVDGNPITNAPFAIEALAP